MKPDNCPYRDTLPSFLTCCSGGTRTKRGALVESRKKWRCPAWLTRYGTNAHRNERIAPQATETWVILCSCSCDLFCSGRMCPKVNRRFFARRVGLPRNTASTLGMIGYRRKARRTSSASTQGQGSDGAEKAESESRYTGAARGFALYPQESEAIQTLQFSEGHVLELISTGAALPDVLDKICTAFDVQTGNVVSVVLLLDEDEHFTRTIAQYGAECGLSVFSCTAILSQSDELLGTFEIYSCFRRSPTGNETMLIERATSLAALAIQLYDHAPDSESPSSPWRGMLGKRFREEPTSEN